MLGRRKTQAVWKDGLGLLCAGALRGFLAVKRFDFVDCEVDGLGDLFIGEFADGEQVAGDGDRLGIGGFTGGFASHIFHSFTHDGHSFLVCFEIVYAVGEDAVIHFLGVGAAEIVHQPAERGLVRNLCIDVDDVGFVAEGLACFSNDTVNVINGQAAAQNVVFGDEDHIDLGEALVGVAGRRKVGVHQAAVVAGAFDAGAFIAALNLDVADLPGGVGGKDIKADGASLQVFDFMLAVDALYFQVAAVEDDLQQKLGAGGIFKDFAHEVVVEQAKVAQALQVLCVLACKVGRWGGLALFHGNHLVFTGMKGGMGGLLSL